MKLSRKPSKIDRSRLGPEALANPEAIQRAECLPEGETVSYLDAVALIFKTRYEDPWKVPATMKSLLFQLANLGLVRLEPKQGLGMMCGDELVPTYVNDPHPSVTRIDRTWVDPETIVKDDITHVRFDEKGERHLVPSLEVDKFDRDLKKRVADHQRRKELLEDLRSDPELAAELAKFMQPAEGH